MGNWFNLSDNVNLLSILGAVIIVCVVLVVVTVVFGKMKQKRENVELSEHNWDGIGEFKNPLPTPWAVMFLVLMVFAIWYFLAGYPLNKYSSIGEYNEEVANYNTKYKDNFSKLSDEEKITMGKRLFFVYCSQCHGAEGTGMNGKAQDLTKWGSVEGILNVLANGSTGLGYGEMPAGLVSGDDAKAVATYVASGFKGEVGKDVFANNCAACHGENGEGTDGVAPALNIYGTAAFIKQVLVHGKIADADASVKVIGTMPSFRSILSDEQMEALGRYVSTLSKE